MTTSPDDRAFFISPIGEAGSEERRRSDTAKRHILEPALVPHFVTGIDRADEIANPGEITPTIIAAILRAKLVVVDLTGHNPNVFYELAVAHAYGIPSIHIRLKGEPIPFDIKDVRVFEYGLDLDSGHDATDAIGAAAQVVLDDPQSIRTPISPRFASSAVISSSGG